MPRAAPIPKRPFGAAARLSSVRNNQPTDAIKRVRTSTVQRGLYGCLVGIRELFDGKLNHEDMDDLNAMLNRTHELSLELARRAEDKCDG